MSRIGKMPVPFPDTVNISVGEESVEVKGPKGSITTALPRGINCKVENGNAIITREEDTKQARAYHGLTRSLISNAVQGVTEGYKKELDIVGVGYKASVEGNKAVFNLGFSHPKELVIPDGIEITVDKATHVVVTGYDKQMVGEVAARIRSMRKPEPYQGKGVHYSDETILRKVGKAAS